MDINNGLIITFIAHSANRLSQITLPISYSSSVSYSALCNIITSGSTQAWDGQVNIKTKTNSTITFPASTDANRQVIAIGY